MAEISQWWDAGGRILYYLSFHLARAFLTVLQRDSYLYWPFLLSALLLVVFVSISVAGSNQGNGETQHWHQRFRSYFTSRLWWHRSARADYRLYFANALIFPGLIAPLMLSDVNIVAIMDSILSPNGATPVDASGFIGVGVRVLFTIVFFVAFDFGRFFAHSLMHDVPALWPFHKVHHSAEVLTPITSYRIHPVEMLLMAWIPALATGVVTWSFNHFAGAGISFYTFLGLHVFIWMFNLVDNLRHSPVWLSYGPRLGQWLISPAHHQLHHSVESRHWGCNRGSNLAIWDRLYGSLYVPGHQPESFRMGLGDDSEANWHNLRTIYVQPFKESFCTLWDFARGRSGSQA
jgi:sterol desaturase/sphingolipid hydroxylase (fatty acid hydroxylase superfamily)